ncbi:MAG TPA: ABC transporter permease subunit [Saprospiraceae bacterium]|nr:ABC transporter permease subunit [Saprospiraceae bacterium]
MKFLGGIEEGTATQKLFFGIAGVLFVLLIWTLLTMGADPIMKSGILPPPLKVLYSFNDLLNENDLLRNIGLSISRNLLGYVEAIVITIPVGFIIGLIRIPRFSFKKQIDAFRFIPLTALIGVFIVWFGISITMKVHFLAFGILLYLLPVMIQRIDEVDDIYLKTAHTLGASDWQILKTVYFPSVISKLFDDLRVLTAISWTYIIVIETINSGEDGIGALIYTVGQRQVKVDRLFALLIIIILIGVIQDRLFAYLDKQFFPYKYQAKEALKSSRIEEERFVAVVGDYALKALGWIILLAYGILLAGEFIPFLGEVKPLSYLFGDTAWVIHVVFFAVLFFKVGKWYRMREDRMALQQATSKMSGK